MGVFSCRGYDGYLLQWAGVWSSTNSYVAPHKAEVTSSRCASWGKVSTALVNPSRLKSGSPPPPPQAIEDKTRMTTKNKMNKLDLVLADMFLPFAPSGVKK